ncbi:MAG TPA: hypothetical protein VIT88_05745, partial [Pyrinomonadaceae bacterium]
RPFRELFTAQSETIAIVRFHARGKQKRATKNHKKHQGLQPANRCFSGFAVTHNLLTENCRRLA